MSDAVIFDVDGVLVDSYQAHFQSWLDLARETGLSFSSDEFATTFGRTSADIIATFWPREDLSAAFIEALDRRKEALYREIVSAEFPAMAGAVELIDALKAAGFRMAVGSSGPPENIDLVLERLERREAFGAVVTGVDVTRGKPDPQVFQIAAERLGVPPQRCAVVEDAPAGIEAAHRANMTAIGFTSTGRTAEDLLAAELVVSALKELSPAGIKALIDR